MNVAFTVLPLNQYDLASTSSIVTEFPRQLSGSISEATTYCLQIVG